MKKKTVITVSIILSAVLVVVLLAVFTNNLLIRNATEIIASQKNPAQPDGSYIIENGNAKFCLTCPEGWDVTASTFILQFDPDVNTTGVLASAIARNDGDTLEKILNDRLEISYQISENVESGYGETILGFPTAWIQDGLAYECFMQIPHGDGFLLLDVKCRNQEDPYPYLRTLANAIQEPSVTGDGLREP